jgi:hypothetical protein
VTTGEPLPWSQLILAMWPLWLSLLAVVIVGRVDQVAAGLAWLFRRGR